MRKIRVSSTLTVYHDGQFWVGVFECVEDDLYSACRLVFGAEPSNEEVLDLVCNRYNALRFTRPTTHKDTPRQAANPLQEEREASARQRKADDRDRREEEKRRRFEQRQKRRKAKRRGK